MRGGSAGPGFAPKRSLGQHFIRDEALLEDLISCAAVGAEDAVLEIGPGFGNMTRILARRCREVLAIEADGRLLPYLGAALLGLKNARVVPGDAMLLDLEELLAPLGPFHVVANIPYYLFTPLLRRLLTLPLPLLSINLTVQKEAAERVTAPSGERGWGPLAVLAQYKTLPRAVREIKAACFEPPPRVDSVFLVMPRLSAPPVRPQDEELFFRVADAAFAFRRKTLLNNLLSAFGLGRAEAFDLLGRAGLPPQARGEALRLDDFAAVSDLLGPLLKGRAAPPRLSGSADKPG